jgi:hypothetical protein
MGEFVYEKIGYIAAGASGRPVRKEVMKRWYDKKPSATPTKIYVSESVANRYGKAVAVYIKHEVGDGQA